MIVGGYKAYRNLSSNPGLFMVCDHYKLSGVPTWVEERQQSDSTRANSLGSVLLVTDDGVVTRLK